MIQEWVGISTRAASIGCPKRYAYSAFFKILQNAEKMINKFRDWMLSVITRRRTVAKTRAKREGLDAAISHSITSLVLKTLSTCLFLDYQWMQLWKPFHKTLTKVISLNLTHKTGKSEALPAIKPACQVIGDALINFAGSCFSRLSATSQRRN